MGRPKGWGSGSTGRPVMRSPGRPPVGRREHRQRFWVAIAAGLSSEAAGVEAGVSPAVGVRWFREGGGMPTVTLAPLSGRYLSFAEREEIALLRAHGLRGAGDRPAARAFAVDDLAGAAPQRGDAQRPVGLSRLDRAVACRAARAAPEAREARRQRASCAGMCRSGCPGRSSGPDGGAVAGPAGAVDGRGTAVARTGGGRGVEPGADIAPAALGLPR